MTNQSQDITKKHLQRQLLLIKCKGTICDIPEEEKHNLLKNIHLGKRTLK